MNTLICTRREFCRGSRAGAQVTRRWTGSLGLYLALCLIPGALAESAKPVLDVAPTVKSTFVDDLNFGKDPFFPKSTRRAPVSVSTNTVVEISVPDLILKGISLSKGKRLALINNYTFGAGEEAEMKIGTQLVKVVCEEIRDKSVIIRVRGQIKELRLRQGL